MEILEPRDENFPSKSELDEFVGSNPKGSIFHSSKWLKVVENQGYDPWHFVVSNGQGEIKAFLPFFICPIPKTSVRIAHSMPQSEMGGPLVASGSDLKEIGSALLKHMRRRAVPKRVLVYTIVTPDVEITSSLLRNPIVESPGAYLQLNLAETPPQQIWDNVFTRDGRQRNNIRKMEKDGVTVRTGVGSDLPEFYSLYVDTLRRAGATPYPYSFLEGIWKSMWPANFHLLLSIYRDEIVGGSAFLCHRERGKVWMLMGGYKTATGTRNTINLFSWWQTLLWAHNNNFPLVELGTDSPDDLNPTFRFKKQFRPQISKKYFVRQPMIPALTLELLREVRGLMERV